MKKIGMMSALLAGGAAFAADGIKMGGFVDAGWSWTKVGDANSNAFAFNDGAFYFGKTMGNGEVMVDMPLEIADLSAIGHGDHFLLAGAHKAQAYVTWKYDNGFNWKLGQFDYVLGFEAADSADRLMASEGIVSQMLPAETQFGTVIGYNVSDSMSFGLVVDNAEDNGAYNMGLTMAMTSDAFNLNAGFMMNNDDSWLFDVNFGTKAGSIGLDFEGLFMNSGVEGADMAMGFLVQAEMEMSETMGLGLRGEFTKANDVNTMAAAFGPHFKMTKDLTVRTDLEYMKAGEGDAHLGAMISAVHKF
jgi:hypothetical protein